MPMLVGWLVAGIAWLFRSQLGQFIVAAMAWIGISFAVNEFAVEPFLDALQMHVQDIGTAGPYAAVALAWFGVLKFDVACTMIGSAVAIKYATGAAGNAVRLVKR